MNPERTESDEMDRFMEQAASLADDLGYPNKPQSDLSSIADETCARRLALLRVQNKIGHALQSAPTASHMGDELLDHGEHLSENLDRANLEYFAALAALDQEHRRSHHGRTTAVHGPGYLAGV